MENKYRVLVVDDDRILTAVFAEGLKTSGYTCRTVSSGAAALALLKEESFDVMVTDLIMPGMDGFVLTRAAKALVPEMAIIMMTGFEQEESYDLAISAGAADFIKKPFTIGELTARIDRVLRDSRILSEIRKKQQEVRDISREMIEGIQEESMGRISSLEQEIVELRKKLK